MPAPLIELSDLRKSYGGGGANGTFHGSSWPRRWWCRWPVSSPGSRSSLAEWAAFAGAGPASSAAAVDRAGFPGTRGKGLHPAAIMR